MRIGALAWHRKRDFAKRSSAPPAEAPVARPTALALAPDDRTPLRIEQAEEPSMTGAEVRERAADFTRWRARHRQLHRKGASVPA